MRSRMAFSPPKRWAAPVTSSKSVRGGIKRHEGREAIAPIGNVFEQRQVCRVVRRHDLKGRQHGARIGQRHSGSQTERGRFAIDRGEAQRVVELGGDDERCRVKRRSGLLRLPPPLQAVGRQTRKPQRENPPCGRDRHRNSTP